MSTLLNWALIGGPASCADHVLTWPAICPAQTNFDGEWLDNKDQSLEAGSQMEAFAAGYNSWMPDRMGKVGVMMSGDYWEQTSHVLVCTVDGMCPDWFQSSPCWQVTTSVWKLDLGTGGIWMEDGYTDLTEPNPRAWVSGWSARERDELRNLLAQNEKIVSYGSSFSADLDALLGHSWGAEDDPLFHIDWCMKTLKDLGRAWRVLLADVGDGPIILDELPLDPNSEFLTAAGIIQLRVVGGNESEAGDYINLEQLKSAWTGSETDWWDFSTVGLSACRSWATQLMDVWDGGVSSISSWLTFSDDGTPGQEGPEEFQPNLTSVKLESLLNEFEIVASERDTLKSTKSILQTEFDEVTIKYDTLVDNVKIGGLILGCGLAVGLGFFGWKYLRRDQSSHPVTVTPNLLG